jgi:hypothetical protein
MVALKRLVYLDFALMMIDFLKTSYKASSSMQEFQYTPLDIPNAQIRVVDLHPFNGALVPHQQQDLRCSVRTINLDDDLRYTALSYTWGSPDRPARLIVDTGGVNQGESAIQITQSLETALLQLRESTKITFWIDQLCINQDDIHEKSEQVPLMEVIYKKAINVLVWLGRANHESDHLLQILDEIGKQATKAERLYGGTSTLALTQTYNVTLFKLRKRHSLGRKFIIPAESLRAFVNRDWWTRVWVVQEISLAASVTFACGAQRITYERLRNALRFYSFHIWRQSTWVQNRHWLMNLTDSKYPLMAMICLAFWSCRMWSAIPISATNSKLPIIETRYMVS